MSLTFVSLVFPPVDSTVRDCISYTDCVPEARIYFPKHMKIQNYLSGQSLSKLLGRFGAEVPPVQTGDPLFRAGDQPIMEPPQKSEDVEWVSPD